MAVYNPLYAVIELLQSRAAITALVPSSRIRFDLNSVEVPPSTSWLIVTGVVPPRINEMRVWRGSVRLTAFAAQMHTAQTIIDTAIEDLYDPLTRFKLFQLSGGSQGGAAVSVTDVFNLSRTQELLSGDIWQPAWAVDLEVQVSAVEVAA